MEPRHSNLSKIEQKGTLPGIVHAQPKNSILETRGTHEVNFGLQNTSKWLQQAGLPAECGSPAELQNQRSQSVAMEGTKIDGAWTCRVRAPFDSLAEV